jgi:hypothetical protein
MLAVATVIGFFACFAVWANREALNTNNWTNISGQMLEDPRVQSALSAYLVNELFKSVNVSEKLNEALPPELRGLSGPLSAGLRQIADQVVPKLLATSQVQQAWRNANRTAHQELIHILDGGGTAVSTEKGVVALNLHQLVTELGTRLGISNQVAGVQSKLSGSSGEAIRSTAKEKLGLTLPENTGRIVILRSNQLSTAQDIAKAVKGLAVLLPALALALFALAIYLARGWRRLALRSTGWCFFGVGVALLLLRRVAGDAVVEGLIKNSANKPAGTAVWSIGTSLLYDVAVAMVLYGLVLVAAAWLTGSTRPAIWLRRAAAPWLREHVTGSYVAAGVLLLLIVFWGPTPATRQILPVLGFAALAALGVTVLRRETELEFPDAMPGEALRQMRASWPFGRGRGNQGGGDGPGRGEAPTVEHPPAPAVPVNGPAQGTGAAAAAPGREPPPDA